MLKSLGIWRDIIISPKEGFGKINEKVSILLPLIVLALLLIGSGVMQVPVITSEVYTQAMTRVGLAQIEKMGMDLTDELIETVKKQQESPLQRSIQLGSVLAGPLITILLGSLLGALYLLIACKIAKGEVTYKLLFKFLIFISIFQVAGIFFNYLFILFSDWETSLSNVTSMAGYQDAMVINFSLAAFIERDMVGNQLYYMISFFTSIFTILFYVFCAFGLKIVAKISTRSTIIVTIIMAIGSMLMGLSSTFLM